MSEYGISRHLALPIARTGERRSSVRLDELVLVENFLQRYERVTLDFFVRSTSIHLLRVYTRSSGQLTLSYLHGKRMNVLAPTKLHLPAVSPLTALSNKKLSPALAPSVNLK